MHSNHPKKNIHSHLNLIEAICTNAFVFLQPGVAHARKHNRIVNQLLQYLLIDRKKPKLLFWDYHLFIKIVINLKCNIVINIIMLYTSIYIYNEIIIWNV